MPFTAAKLLAMLRLEPLDWERIGATDLVAAGHRIGTPELLFEKIEDDVIQAQLDKLRRPRGKFGGRVVSKY